MAYPSSIFMTSFFESLTLFFSRGKLLWPKESVRELFFYWDCKGLETISS